MTIDNKLVPLYRFPDYTHDDGEWNVQKVGEIIKTITPPKKLQSKEYREKGKYPIIDQSQEFICGYSDDDSAVINKDANELVVFGDHTCVLKFINFPFIQGADGIKIFKSKDPKKINIRYLYQYI